MSKESISYGLNKLARLSAKRQEEVESVPLLNPKFPYHVVAFPPLSLNASPSIDTTPNSKTP